jgi:hypothetical protein
MGVMCFACLRHDVVLDGRRVGGCTPFEGVVVHFRGVQHGKRTRVGSIVPRSDTDHSAQRVHSAGDGCTAADCSNSTEIGFPGCVRGSVWRGFSFDPGARGGSGHLMLRLGEQVRRRRIREVSSEAETRSRD